MIPWAFTALAYPPAVAPRKEIPPVARELPGERMPDRLWDVVHLDLDVVLDLDARTVQGTATHTLQALGRPRDRVRFHQESLTIDAVTVDGAPGDFTTGAGWVDVALPPGATHEVAIAYHARPPRGLYFRGPAWDDPVTEVYTQGEDEDNRWWYPGWDFPNDRFTVTTHVTAPTALTVRALGEQTARAPLPDGRTRTSFAIDQPVVNYLVALVAGDYQVVELDGPVPIEVLAARTVPRDVVERSASALPDMLRYYADLLDEPFPYPRLRLVYVQRYLYGGMENPTLTVMNDRLLLHEDSTARERRNHAVQAHEVVHHWFGDLITCLGWNPWWLNEGFAEHYEARYMAHRYGAEAEAVQHLSVGRHARKLDRALEPTGATREPDTPFETWNGSYPKGAMVLSDLRERLTPAVFDAAIARYVDTHANAFVEGQDLRRVLEEASGTSLAAYFDAFVHGRGIPAYTVDQTFEDGALVLTFDPEEDAPTAVFTVDVAIGTSTGVRHATVALDDRRTRFTMPLDSAPHWVLVDPDRSTLARFAHDAPTYAWLTLARGTEGALAQAIAIDALGRSDDEEARRRLLELVDADLDHDLRVHVVRALGHHASTTDGGKALRRLALDDRMAGVRRAAAQQLTAAAVDRTVLDRVALDDPDSRTRAAALRRLQDVHADDALVTARKVLSRPDRSFRGGVHARALSILGRTGERRDHAAIVRALSSPRYRTREAAFWAMDAQLKTLDDGRARTRLQDALAMAVARRLDDPETDARWLALRTARHLRPEHIGLLERFAAGNTYPPLDEVAAESIEAIRAPRPEATADARLDSLERTSRKLERTLAELEDRLDDLDER